MTQPRRLHKKLDTTTTNFKNNLSLLFMLGHTITGERHTVGYLGLYYTWGKNQAGRGAIISRGFSGG